MKYQIYECGICGSWHRADWYGDCREDCNRYADPEDFAALKGVKLEYVEIVDMPGQDE